MRYCMGKKKIKQLKEKNNIKNSYSNQTDIIKMESDIVLLDKYGNIIDTHVCEPELIELWV